MDQLAAFAEANADKVAVIDDRPDGSVRSVTYGELNLLVNRMANALGSLGATAPEALLWCGPNSIETIAVTHAARKAGLVQVPLNYRLSPDEAVYVIDHCDARFAMIDAVYAERFAELAPRLATLEHVIVFGGEPLEGQLGLDAVIADLPGGGAEEPGAGSTEPAAGSIWYTSGTTGVPKGAIKPSTGDPAQLGGMLDAVRYFADGIHITTGPLYHSGPGGFASRAMSRGQTVVVQRKFDALDWLRLVDTYSVSTTFSAPAPIRIICDLDDHAFERYDTSSMASMVANAAPWSMALKRAYLERFPPDSLWEIYGSSELGVTTMLAPEDQLRKPGSCGKPAPTVQIRLYDDDGELVTEPNQPGELFVKASSVFSAYHKDPDAYLADQRDGFQTVGDIAYFDDEGYYFICDRKKDMIITGGMNVYPAEVEGALDSHPLVFEAAVFGLPDEKWGERVHAVVVRRPPAAGDDELTHEALIAHARAHIASYKAPRSVEFVDELPKTGSGKVLKRELRPGGA